MPEPTTDPVAAYLAKARERSERPLGPTAGALPISSDAVRHVMESAADVPRLLAVAEAALALVTGWRNEATSLDERAEQATDKGEAMRSLGLSYRAQAHTDCAAQLKAAISAALLGEEHAGD